MTRISLVLGAVGVLLLIAVAGGGDCARARLRTR
ncbi:MAG: hypothetical protein UY99_C0002G0018 [Parcubacteria group bacterium GW2011_GWA1_59_11]|nr:MAG: hypothetical protein UY99_C0002G0018 [Parcubacteria group bacterium GW2011_GWA1_59_11]